MIHELTKKLRESRGGREFTIVSQEEDKIIRAWLEEKAEELKEKEAEETERKKLLAPDKEKLLSFATELSLIKAPAVKSREADQVMAKATKQIEDIVLYLQEEAKKL